MSETGSRGPNDFRSRDGKRRREPPIIDASATEAPPDAAAAGPTPPADRPAEVADPVLFGSAVREPVKPETQKDRPPEGGAGAQADAVADAAPPSDVAVEEPHPAAVAEPPPDISPAHAGSNTGPAGGSPPLGGAPPSGGPIPRNPAPAGGSGRAAPWLLSLAILGLLVACAWLLYADLARRGDRDGTAAAVTDLKSRVATLEARPDPGPIQTALAALDERVTAADADRASLAETVAGLSSRIDDLTRQVEAAKAEADKAPATAAAAPPSAAPADAGKPEAAPQGAPATADGGTPEAAPQTAALPAAATVGAIAALAAKLDGLDGRVAALADDQTKAARSLADLTGEQVKTAAAVAALPKPVAPDFGPIDARVEQLEERFTATDGRTTALDGRLTTLDGKANHYDARLNEFDAKVNGVDGKINGFDARMNGFDARSIALEARQTDGASQIARLQTDGAVQIAKAQTDVAAQIAKGQSDAAAQIAKAQGDTAAQVAKARDDAATQVAGLQATVAGLPKVDLGPLQASADALDKRVVTIEGQLAAAKDGARLTEARAVGSAEEARATPLALVGEEVGRAVAEGRPFAPDLQALKALGAEPDAVARLEPLAADGAPSADALKDRWEAVSGDVLSAVKPAEASGALDRFAAQARGLVQVRRVGAQEGDDASALASQVGAALGEGDVPAALAAWNKLPEAGKAKSRDWAAAAMAEADAAEAARSIVARAIAALGRTKS